MKLNSLLVVFAAIFLPALSARAVVLELKDQQTLTSSSLTLNDILVSSQGLTSDDLAVVLAAAPPLGKQQTWTRDSLTAVLPDAIKAQNPTWTGAKACVVSRPSVAYGEAEARELIATELAQQVAPDSKFEVLELPGYQPFPIPDGTVEARVELSPGTLRNEWGEATLEFKQQGEVAVTKSVRFHWSCTRTVWQAINRVTNGDALTATDFQQVEVDVLKIPGDLQPANSFPDGKVAAHILAQGKILMENDWVEPTLVNRDDLVTILYDHNGLSITVQAKAMANGTRNQVIEVQNLSSHKIFNARVVDERTLVYDQ
jgi:flagella basal body P-ring formation protein FlgA